MNAFQPIGRRLNRSVRRIVGELEEKRPLVVLAVVQKVDRPSGEEVGRVPLRIDGVQVVAEIVDPVPLMCHIVVHHVAEPAVKDLEASRVGHVGRREPQVPFPDQGRRIAGRLEQSGQ